MPERKEKAEGRVTQTQVRVEASKRGADIDLELWEASSVGIRTNMLVDILRQGNYEIFTLASVRATDEHPVLDVPSAKNGAQAVIVVLGPPSGRAGDGGANERLGGTNKDAGPTGPTSISSLPAEGDEHA